MMVIEDLWRELREHPGRFGVAVGERTSDTLAGIAARSGLAVLDVGRCLTVDHPDGWKSPEDLLLGTPLLDHLEILFWPAVPVDPLLLLGVLARRHPLVAAWPGEIEGRRARFSEPGRPDYYDQLLLPSAIVLRAVATSFPDELPYEVERTR